jgi:enoyl-CoA hydratase
MAYETLLTEVDDAVAIITLNRPDALNAFNNALMDELTEALDRFDNDASIGCIVLTGSRKAFAAGADIKEMREQSYLDAYYADFITRNWERASRMRKPVIAAVSGYALGGGCELAMMCDFILAAYETTLSQGVMFERRLFHSLFATEDQKEGMAAFVEKREPHFNNR